MGALLSLVPCHQGALRRFKSRHGDGFTRDYSGLWQRMMALRAAGQSLPRVVVVGKGERGDLHLPPQLEDRVAFHPWLRYPVSARRGETGKQGVAGEDRKREKGTRWLFYGLQTRLKWRGQTPGRTTLKMAWS